MTAMMMAVAMNNPNPVVLIQKLSRPYFTALLLASKLAFMNCAEACASAASGLAENCGHTRQGGEIVQVEF